MVVFLRVFFIFTSIFAFASNKAALPKDEELKHREYMVEISRQLGVTCNYCHDVKNFKSPSMPTWKKSKDHMNIVELLNTRGFLKGPKADCYMCHRGKAVPEYKEVLPASDTKHH